MRKTGYLVCLLLFLFASVSAGRREEAVEKVSIENAREVRLNVELGAGEFSIKSGDKSEAMIAEIMYNPDKVEYSVDSDHRNNICVIDLESEHRNTHSIDTEDNIWDIELSKKYPYEIQMDIGACVADFDLGGLPLKELSLNIGAAKGTVTFSQPNPERLRDFEVDAGATSLKITEIGNANFDHFEFEGGAGSFDLDFTGKYKGESEISIDIGLGELDLVLPENIPVRIITDGDNWLSSIELNNRHLREVKDDVYESKDFDTAETRLIVKLTVGLGSIDVEWY